MLSQSVIAELRQVLRDTDILVEQADLISYSIDGTWLEARPDCVVMPRSAAEVAAVMRIANRERIPVVPRGGASNLSGGTIPVYGGIVLNLAQLNRILEIDTQNLVAVVQPGVLTHDLQTAVGKHGLYYPPDPSSLKQSTLGGNIAENAGGLRCLKYGVTSKYVLGLEYVTPTGEIGRAGGRVIKNVTGYQLEQLLVGSEGTLAVVTEISLRLIPYPAYKRTAMAIFPTLEGASRTVAGVTSAGIVPAAMELMDRSAVRLVEDYLHLGLPTEAEAILLIEVDGNHEGAIEDEMGRIAAILEHNGATVQRARDERESEALWTARRSVSPATARLRPNKLGEDVSVPRSAVPAMIRRCREIAAKYDLPMPVWGHAGDGNVHPNLLFDRRNPAEVERVQQAAGEIFEAAVELGGTLSGEHGIGLLKREFIGMALDPTTIAVMKAVKRALDPNNILNPGKIFPDGEGNRRVPVQLVLSGSGAGETVNTTSSPARALPAPAQHTEGESTH